MQGNVVKKHVVQLDEILTKKFLLTKFSISKSDTYYNI